MALRSILKAARKLKRFVPGNARRVRHRRILQRRGITNKRSAEARQAIKQDRTARFAKGKARVEGLKQGKKQARARNIANIRRNRLLAERKRLRGARIDAIKARIPGVVRKAALPVAGVAAAGTAGFVAGKRNQRKSHSRRR